MIFGYCFTMHWTLHVVLLVFVITFSNSLPQNDLNSNFFSEPASSYDIALNVPLPDAGTLADQPPSSDDDDANSLRASCVDHPESEKQTEGKSTIDIPTKMAWDLEPPFSCKNGKLPACCVYPLRYYKYLCKAWGVADLVMCVQEGDWGCCASFGENKAGKDKIGYGVDCDKDIVITPKQQRQRQCPA